MTRLLIAAIDLIAVTAFLSLMLFGAVIGAATLLPGTFQ